MIKRILATLCIIAGIVVFLYPTITDRYESFQQQRMMKQWAETLKQIDQATETTEIIRPAIIPVPLAAVAVSAPANERSGDNQPQPSIAEPEPTPEPTPDPLRHKQVEGVLIIDKIDLKLPIITDATVNNLKLSVASIAGTGTAGALGNYAIAGHRNLTYGKNFNRLDEVDKGDLIEVDTGKGIYKYEVQKKQYVLPEDVWVLQGNGKDREITLVTCHPMVNPTQRLIVKGKLIEKQ